MGLLKVGTEDVSDYLSSCGTPLLLLGCLVQPCCDGMCLDLLLLFMPCLVDVPCRPALFGREVDGRWIWRRGELWVRDGARRRGKTAVGV